MREAQELSVRGLAARAGVNPGYLSQVERGLADPTGRWTRAVEEALAEHLAERRAA